MSYIDHFTAFLFDENRRLSSKAAVVVFVFLAILLIDNILGFSYYFNTDKKIEQVQKLNYIIKDATSDSNTKAFALQLRSEIIDRENVILQTFSFFRNIKWKSSRNAQISIPKETDKTNESVIRNNFWFNISAGGLYYLLAIIMIPLMVFTDKTTSFLQRLATGILTSALFFAFGWFFYWVCNFIPQLSKSTWAWNYILNILIQVIFVGLLLIAGQKKQASRYN